MDGLGQRPHRGGVAWGTDGRQSVGPCHQVGRSQVALVIIDERLRRLQAEVGTRVVDVVFWDPQADGGAAMWSLAAQTGSQDGQPVTFPDEQAAQRSWLGGECRSQDTRHGEKAAPAAAPTQQGAPA